MYHISVNLAMGQREKILGVQKAPRGGKKAIMGRQKIVSTFIFFRHQSFRGGAKKSAGGDFLAPLRHS